MQKSIFITVHTGSTRLLQKALKKINDISTIEHLIKRLKHSKKADDIILSTTDLQQDRILCDIASQNNIINSIILRLANVYGPSLSESKAEDRGILNKLTRMRFEGKNIQIYGDGNNIRDYVYIDDVLDLIPKISINGKDKSYNIGSGKNIESEKLINKISEITGCSVEVSSDAKEYSYPETSIIKIKKELTNIEKEL